MRKFVLSFVFTGIMCSAVFGSPLLIEKAGNYLNPREFEAGLNNVTYSLDRTEYEGVDLETDVSQIFVPLFGRYAWNDTMEFSATIPYRLQTVKTTTGGETDSDTDSDLGNAGVAGKYNFLLDGLILSGNLKLGLPTGGDDFKQGFDIYPSISIRKNVEPVIVNANLGYKLTGSYELDDETGTEINPGDILSLGGGLEYPFSEEITFAGELIYENLTSLQRDGTEIDGTDGSRTEIIGGLRLNRGSYRTKLGLGVSLGEETYREYDYRIFAGITYRL